MIPLYPSFGPLEKSDQPLFEQAFADNPPEISEYTFTNLYAWRTIYQFQASLRDGFILLRPQKYSTQELPVSARTGSIIVPSDKDAPPVFFPPVGKGNPKETMLAILKETRGSFVRLPETVKNLFENDAHVFFEFDADNADYLFLADDLVNLKGKKYDGKRNLIKKFKSMYQYEYVSAGQDRIKEYLDFADAWCVVKGCDTVESLNDERSAFKEMLAHFSDFNIKAGAIKIEGRIRAFVLAQKLNPETLVIHMLKAYSEITGLYQTVYNEFLARQDRDFGYVNMEQDLGVAGLRKAKLSYQPVRILKKYTMRLT